MLSWLCIFHFVQCTTQGIKAPSENTVMGLAHWSLVPPCQFFLSLLLSFSGWSLGAQGPSVFTYLPVLLRPKWEGALRFHSLGRPGGWLWPTWTVQVPCLGAQLAFCINQGISASFLSSSLLTANSFLFSLYICISLSPHCSCFGYPGSNWGWTPLCNLKNNIMNLFTK